MLRTQQTLLVKPYRAGQVRVVGIVGGVSDWGLCEDFDQRVKRREVYVPSSMVSMQVVQFTPSLFCVLLRVGLEFVE